MAKPAQYLTANSVAIYINGIDILKRIPCNGLKIKNIEIQENELVRCDLSIDGALLEGLTILQRAQGKPEEGE